MYFDRRTDEQLDSDTVRQRLAELEQLMADNWRRKMSKAIKKILVFKEKRSAPGSPD